MLFFSYFFSYINGKYSHKYERMKNGKKNMGNYDLDISELSYKLYQSDWKQHHVAPEEERETIKDWYEEGEGEAFSDYLSERGYHGHLYACYEEFLENEFRDRDYIEGLLGRGSLKEQYEEYVGELER